MRTAGWRIIWKKIIAVILRNFCSWEKKAFCSCVYNCDDLLSYNCLCIVCINVETMTDIFLVVALKVPWPFAVQNQEFPFYDNLYSLQNRKKKTRPSNFLCFRRDASGIKTKPFVPATDTVDQLPNVSPQETMRYLIVSWSPLVIFAKLTSTFFVQVLYWNIFQILLKGIDEQQREKGN